MRLSMFKQNHFVISVLLWIPLILLFEQMYISFFYILKKMDIPIMLLNNQNKTGFFIFEKKNWKFLIE